MLLAIQVKIVFKYFNLKVNINKIIELIKATYSLLPGCLAYPGLTICRAFFFFAVDCPACCGIGDGCIGSGNNSTSGLAVI